MQSSIQLVGILATAGLAATAVSADASAAVATVAQSVAVHRQTAQDGWRDGGRIAGLRGGATEVMMDSSTSHVLVAAVTTTPGASKPLITTIARRMPDGHWDRQAVHIGRPVGVDVNARGDAVIVSQRDNFATGASTLLAATWRRGADNFRTRVILPAADAPQYYSARLSANGRGDVAVLATADLKGDRAQLLRKPLHKPWKRTLSIRRAKYGGVLDGIDLTDNGVVVGAFKQDQTLSVRHLPLHRNRFGRATEVTTWAAIVPSSYAWSRAAVKVGPNGDLATAWTRGEKQDLTTRINIVPATAKPWQGKRRNGSGIELINVAADGSVVIEDLLTPLRWERSTRSFRGNPASRFKDVNERGDLLVGGGLYGGPLQVWPVGEVREPVVESPRGRQLAWVMTNDHRVYVADGLPADSPQAVYLRIRQF